MLSVVSESLPPLYLHAKYIICSQALLRLNQGFTVCLQVDATLCVTGPFHNSMQSNFLKVSALLTCVVGARPSKLTVSYFDCIVKDRCEKTPPHDFLPLHHKYSHENLQPIQINILPSKSQKSWNARVYPVLF